MPKNAPLLHFASELADRLEQFGFRKGPADIGTSGRERYRTVARLKVAGAGGDAGPDHWQPLTD